MSVVFRPNWRLTMRRASEIVYERVVAHNGIFQISAERGIGELKRCHFLALKNPIELELMVKIKRALDPKGLLNPGKLLPDEAWKS